MSDIMSDVKESNEAVVKYHLYLYDCRDPEYIMYTSLISENFDGFLYKDKDVMEYAEHLASDHFEEYYNKCQYIRWSRDILMFGLYINRYHYDHPSYNIDDPETGVWVISDKDLDYNLNYYSECEYGDFVDIILKSRNDPKK